MKNVALGAVIVLLLLAVLAGCDNVKKEDTIAPVIRVVAVLEITTSEVTITWTTAEAATSQIEYGTTASYGSSFALNANLVTTHSVTLTELTANTNYHYRVKSKDASGNEATSGDYTFTTNQSIFPDPNLETVIREAINKPAGDIHQSDLTEITVLQAPNRSITDLTGLENCTAITELDLANNRIGNLRPLSNLTKLTKLWIPSNQIMDVSALENLTSLTTLSLDRTRISDLSPLANLNNLAYLSLNDNARISDIVPLSNLTSLATLHLYRTRISDLSPLVKLTNLVNLSLYSPEITDISPLANLIGLTHLVVGHYGRIDEITDV